MKFYDDLYVGESIKKVNNVKWKLRTGAGQFQIYIISLSHSSDQLDIFHCSILKQKHFNRKDLYIVGLASSKPEAWQLVGKMLADTIAAGMEGNIKGYLLKRISESEGGRI